MKIISRSNNIIKSERNGFSFNELMIGISILLVVVIGALQTFINCMLLNESSRNLVTAANDAQYALEQIRGHDFSDIQNFITNYSPTKFTNLPNENITFPNPIYTLALDTITAQITWDEKNTSKTLSITTRFAQ